MQPGEIYHVFTDRLEALGLKYLVTGSVASSTYGEPRFTHDIEVVLIFSVSAIDRLWHAFPVDEFYCPPAAVLPGPGLN